MHKVSVVMASYNGVKYLHQQLQSILNQTLKPDEIIICDDASTDGTVNILEEYAKKKQITYVVNNVRLGFIDNFKKAVAMAKPGNYVSLSDQDDEWLPDKLERSVALLETIDKHNKPCMVYSDLIWVDQNDEVLNYSFNDEFGKNKFQHNLQTSLFSNLVNGCTIVMNSELIYFFSEMPSDVRVHDEWIALAAFTFGQAEYIKSPLMRYRRHGNNLSNPANTKPQNRYRNNITQLVNAIKGNKKFLSEQISVIQKFYDYYEASIPTVEKLYFEHFLALEHKSYLSKKLAFRSVVNKFRVK